MDPIEMYPQTRRPWAAPATTSVHAGPSEETDAVIAVVLTPRDGDGEKLRDEAINRRIQRRALDTRHVVSATASRSEIDVIMRVPSDWWSRITRDRLIVPGLHERIGWLTWTVNWSRVGAIRPDPEEPDYVRRGHPGDEILALPSEWHRLLPSAERAAREALHSLGIHQCVIGSECVCRERGNREQIEYRSLRGEAYHAYSMAVMR